MTSELAVRGELAGEAYCRRVTKEGARWDFKIASNGVRRRVAIHSTIKF